MILFIENINISKSSVRLSMSLYIDRILKRTSMDSRITKHILNYYLFSKNSK